MVSLPFLKNVSLDIEFHLTVVFFQFLNHFVPFALAPLVSDEKSVIIWIPSHYW